MKAMSNATYHHAGRRADQGGATRRAGRGRAVPGVRQGDICAHQGEIESTLSWLVADRRAQLLSDRQLNTSIGFPVKRRGDAETYTIPIRRTRLAVRATSKTPARRFTPEPALADDDYEAALAVLLNARNASSAPRR